MLRNDFVSGRGLEEAALTVETLARACAESAPQVVSTQHPPPAIRRTAWRLLRRLGRAALSSRCARSAGSGGSGG